MKKLMELMAEELASAFEKPDMIRNTARLRFPTDRIFANISATGQWLVPKHIRRLRL